MSMITQAPDLLNVDEVAHRLGVSRRTAYRLLKSGDLPKPVKIRGMNRWRSTDLAAYIASLPATDGADQ